MTKNSSSHSGASVPAARSLVAGAMRSGLSADAGDALVANLTETVLLGCVGTSADDLDATDATLVSVVLDMSGSMSGFAPAVLDAYNTMLRALASSKQAASIVLSTWAFADQPRLLAGWQPVHWHAPLTSAEYAPDGMTALYDAVLGAMTGLVAYGQSLADHGVLTKRVVFVLSDGGDNVSVAKAHDVKRAATGLLAQECYTLAYAGFGSSDLASLAASVGFPSVVTTGATEKELRAIFKQVSASVMNVSRGAGASSFF